MEKSMNALVYDRARDPWGASKGLRKEEVAAPGLDESADWRDGHMAIIRTKYAGFCGSDRGIWFRRAFGDMIGASRDQEHREVRVCGHELGGEIVAIGSQAARESGLVPGDFVSAE